MIHVERPGSGSLDPPRKADNDFDLINSRLPVRHDTAGVHGEKKLCHDLHVRDSSPRAVIEVTNALSNLKNARSVLRDLCILNHFFFRFDAN